MKSGSGRARDIFVSLVLALGEDRKADRHEKRDGEAEEKKEEESVIHFQCYGGGIFEG